MTLASKATMICGAAAVAALGLIAAMAASIEYGLAREIWALRATGYGALTALSAALAMTPLGALRRRALGVESRSPAAFRRSLGIIAAFLALVHGSLAVATYLQDSWQVILVRPFFRSGALAVAILTALMLTSFPPIVRALRITHWKQLHRLAYVAALLTLHHLVLSAFAPRLTVFIVAAIFLILGALRLAR